MFTLFHGIIVGLVAAAIGAGGIMYKTIQSQSAKIASLQRDKAALTKISEVNRASLDHVAKTCRDQDALFSEFLEVLRRIESSDDPLTEVSPLLKGEKHGK